MNKIHDSWLKLSNKVSKDDILLESFKEYYSRIKQLGSFSHIPDEVLEQWLYLHHHHNFSKINYGWINYENVQFKTCELETEKLIELNTLDSHDSYKSLASNTKIKDFCCSKTDKKFWKNNGTWKTPPVVIDVESFKPDIPAWTDIKGKFHLVEGYSRLGYLLAVKAMSEQGEATIAATHNVFLMSRII